MGERGAALVDNPSPGQFGGEGADGDAGAEHGCDGFAAAPNAPLQGNEVGVGLEGGGEAINIVGEVRQASSPSEA